MNAPRRINRERRAELLALVVILIIHALSYFYGHNGPLYGGDHPGHILASARLNSANALFSVGIRNPVAQLLQFEHGFFTQLFPFLIYKAISFPPISFSTVVWDMPVYIAGVGILLSVFTYGRLRGVAGWRLIIPLGVLAATPAFVGLSRVLVGNQTFTLLWLAAGFASLEYYRTANRNGPLLYLALACYIGSSSVSFLGYFGFFPLYQIVLESSTLVPSMQDCTRAVRKFYWNRWNVLPAGFLVAYVMFSVVYFLIFQGTQYAMRGYVLQLVAKTGGGGKLDFSGLPDIVFSGYGGGILVLGVAVLVFIIASNRMSEIESGTIQRVALFGLIGLGYTLLTLPPNVHFMYAVLGLVPLTLLVMEASRHAPSIPFAPVGLAVLLITAGVTGQLIFLGFERPETMGPPGSTSTGSVKPEDGSRAVGYFIREWQTEGKLPPSAERGHSPTFLSFSTKKGDQFYTSHRFEWLKAYSLSKLKSDWRILDRAAQPGYNVREVEDNEIALVEEKSVREEATVALIIYRMQLGDEFDESLDYLKQQDRLHLALVVVEDERPVAAVFTSERMNSKPKRVEAEPYIQAYRTKYDGLQDYDQIYLGAY